MRAVTARQLSNKWPLPPKGIAYLRTLRHSDGFGPRIAWSPSGEVLAIAVERAVYLYDHESGIPIRRLETDREVMGLCFDPDGEFLATAGGRRGGRSKDGTIHLWHVRSGRLLATREARQASCLAFSADGSLIATGHADAVRIWDVRGGGLRLRFQLSDGSESLLINSCAFAPDGGTLVTVGDDRRVRVWDTRRGAATRISEPHGELLQDVSMHPNGRLVATASDDLVRVWAADTGKLLHALEGHTSVVFHVSFIADGRMLASYGADGVRLWSAGTWDCVRVLALPPTGWRSGSGFHPYLSRFAIARGATDGSNRLDIHVWEYDADLLLGQVQRPSVTYTTAKIVLVGDSGVGKTGLGWRLTHGEFKEHASTHGQQFWLLDDLGATRADGAQCDAILWDLAGQPDYRLIHALFLDDADLALVLFDPTRDDAPLQGVEYWLRQLGVLNGRTSRPVILVAARSDRGTSRMTKEEIDRFCAQVGIRSHVTTSALTGDGLPQLVAHMRAAVQWDEQPTTVTTETFRRIKNYVLAMKEERRPEQVIFSAPELRRRLEQDRAVDEFSNAEMLTAVGHLSNHGYVSRLRTSQGEERILLAPELLNNVASSIVLEARRNPKGLGSLEEWRVLAGEHRIPELEQLSDAERDVLLDSAVAMFLEHNVCFRETDPLSSRVYLVFPELINLRKPAIDDGQPVEETIAYTISGAVENLYASLVVLLGYTSTFTRANQWHNQARYVVGDGLVCGFLLEAEREGELDFVLYFGTNVGTPVRALFQGLFESFLARRVLTVRRYEPVACSKGHQLNRAVVREHLTEGDDEVFCTRCGELLPLRPADTPIELTRAQTDELRLQRRAAVRRTRFEQAIFRLKTYATQEEIAAPDCFISYAWGDPAQERWVEYELAADLAKAGIPVILDRWENARIGASVPRFVERVQKAARVIVVGTPAYRTKYDNNEPMRGFVVAAEGDLIGARMIGPELRKESVLPVLLEGTEESSLPPLLHGRVYADLRDPESYFTRVFDLILSLYRIRPQLLAAVEMRDLLDS